MCIVFFLNDPATTEIYTLSLRDALPIYHFWVSVQWDSLARYYEFDKSQATKLASELTKKSPYASLERNEGVALATQELSHRIDAGKMSTLLTKIKRH